MTRATCVVVVLTFNAANIIRETLTQARKVSTQVLVVDSGSTDGTLEQLATFGCDVRHRAFANYGDQRNWAIAEAAGLADWQLHLDADEVLDDTAIGAICAVLSDPSPRHISWLLRRRDYFLGRPLRFSGLNPWHLRLFRTGQARCESRLYDQHFVTDQPTGRLPGLMHDKNAMTLSDWTARHNRWSDLEVAELLREDASATQGLAARLDGDPRERTRYLKGRYYRLPAGWRALAYFGYRYVLRGGFLDGRAGFYFAVLQALWFRLLVDAKLHEKRHG